MRYYDNVITSLKYSRDMLIDAKGSDYSGVAAMTAAIEHLEKEHASRITVTDCIKSIDSIADNLTVIYPSLSIRDLNHDDDNVKQIKEHIKTLKYVSYMLGRELIDNDVL
jgi:hypothetical protein